MKIRQVYDDVGGKVKYDEPPSSAFVPMAEKRRNLSHYELARTFNCGVGMLIYVSADTADSALSAIQQQVKMPI